MIVPAVFLFCGLLVLDLPALLRERRRRELAVYLVLGAVTLLFMVQYAVGVEIFSPIKYVSIFFERVLGLNYELWQGHA